MPCLILRIGFVGEVGYELHFPAAHGEHLWDALLEAGDPHGLRPFGLEPQRLLRLQKMHILIGQDTDSESTPFGAAMSWIVKLDKDQDFIGKWALERVADEDLETALVGIKLQNGHAPRRGGAAGRGRAGRPGRRARAPPQLGGVTGRPGRWPWRGRLAVTNSDEGKCFEAEPRRPLLRPRRRGAAP